MNRRSLFAGLAAMPLIAASSALASRRPTEVDLRATHDVIYGGGGAGGYERVDHLPTVRWQSGGYTRDEIRVLIETLDDAVRHDGFRIEV